MSLPFLHGTFRPFTFPLLAHSVQILLSTIKLFKQLRPLPTQFASQRFVFCIHISYSFVQSESGKQQALCHHPQTTPVPHCWSDSCCLIDAIGAYSPRVITRIH